MNIVTVYVAGERHVVADSATILSRAKPGDRDLERYKARLDEGQPATVHRRDRGLRDAARRHDRGAAAGMVRRIGLEIDYDAQSGPDGRLVAVAAGRAAGQRHGPRTDRARLSRQPRPAVAVPGGRDAGEPGLAVGRRLLDFTALARVFGYPVHRRDPGLGAQLRGFTGRWPTSPPAVRPVDLLVRRSVRCRDCWRPVPPDLQSVDPGSVRCGLATSGRDCPSWPSRRSPTGWADSSRPVPVPARLRGRVPAGAGGEARRFGQDERHRGRPQVAQLDPPGCRCRPRSAAGAAGTAADPSRPGDLGGHLLTGD